MTRAEFAKLVERGIERLSPRTREVMENVAVVVEAAPTAEQLRKTGVRKGDTLLGLYEGVPRTQWGRGFGGNLPDKITIFQDSIESVASTPEEAEQEVADTVRHEVAHHFGYTDEELG